MADLAAPVRVSPLIKVRFGILYGLSRNRSLGKKEAAYREVEDKKRAEREAKHAAEKERLSKEELINLAKAAGVDVKP
ncbi:hypothetical protein B566_EDAN005025 [Ephemera danica]|nr:hypothetical protein B566_EDAN005025 [Ephemera danica]